MSDQNHETVLNERLSEVGLNAAKWARVLQEHLGIQTVHGLQYIGKEAYQLLVHFVTEPQEKIALRFFLKLHKTNVAYRVEQKTMLEMRCNALKETLDKLRNCQTLRKYRQDDEMQALEKHFWEILQVPESVWIGKDNTISAIVPKMGDMLNHIENTCNGSDIKEVLLLEQASDGLAVKGINPNDLTVHNHILKLPKDIELSLPLRSQYTEQIHFESKHEEEQFFRQFKMFGCGIPHKSSNLKTATMGREESYCSTVKYSFIPLASCFFDDHHLQLSDEAVSHLTKIDRDQENYATTNQFEAECRAFLKRFGSHSLKGPFHLGGVYVWKCYSSGFPIYAHTHVQKLQQDVINANTQMCINKCLDKICVFDIQGYSFDTNETLQRKTFMEVIITGGSPLSIGFPDWKNGLLGSNESWKLIDCGSSMVPVWDIIIRNHNQHFSRSLATTLKKQWEKLYCTTKSDSIKERVKGWNVKPPFDNNKLSILLNKRRDLERGSLDPEAWASQFLTAPFLQEFLCSLVRVCNDDELRVIKRAIQDITEPMDLGITKVFSHLENGIKRVFDTDKDPPPVQHNNFISIQRYFKMAMGVMSTVQHRRHSQILSSDRGTNVIHPYLIMKATSTVEKAIKFLHNHLEMTGQKYEECLLITLLHPLEYNPKEKRFPILLTKSDIEYLCNNFANLSEECFALLLQPQKEMIKVQSYLFYLTVHVADMMAVREECIVSNMIYLQQKLDIMPEIESCLPQIKDWKLFQMEMERVFREDRVKAEKARPHNIEHIYEEITFKTPNVCVLPATRDLTSKQQSIFVRLGLLDYFPQKLSVQEALEIREDTYQLQSHEIHQSTSPMIGSLQTGFVVLNKILAFDHTCRMAHLVVQSVSDSESDSEEEDDDDDDDDDDDESIHPMDGLLALLHCCDNFLRQDLLCRLTTCQVAVPLLLPHLTTKEPTLMLWALRSIVKQFKMQDQTIYTGRLITFPAPFVSFLRIGEHSMSKSEILNGVINKPGSDNKNMIFLSYNYPGGSKRRLLVDGLVEVGWYLPGNALFDKAIGFTNLRGDASKLEYQKQIKFLCEISSLHVVLLSDNELKEDALRHDTIELLKQLAQAPAGVFIVQTRSKKGFKGCISQHFTADEFKSKYYFIKYDKSSTIVCEKIQNKLRSKLETTSPCASLENAARMHDIPIDELHPDCSEGKLHADQFYAVIEEHQKSTKAGSPKCLLPLQGSGLWHRWAKCDKEQYRHKNQYQHEHYSEIELKEAVPEHQRNRKEMLSQEYGELQRKIMSHIREEQYPLAIKLNKLMSTFVRSLTTLKGHALWYYMVWLKFKLDDLSQKILPPFHTKIRQKRNQLSEIQNTKNDYAEHICQKELKELDLELINASFGVEHLLRELSQIYEAVTTKDKNPLSKFKDLPQIAAQLLCDGFPIEILDGDASHMPQKWISAVLQCLSRILHKRISCEPKIYVLSVLGVQSTGKSTLLNTLFGVQFSVSAGRCTRGAFMQLIPVNKSLYTKLGVHYFLLIDTEGLRAPELDRLNAREHDNELATFVIGIANLTLINVAGEVAGDMNDILHTAVHAFLRMSQVSLKPSCHIVHHHVAAVEAEEKMMMGRFKTKENLDRMTKAAAKETGLEFNRFSDVIKFDHVKDVSFFPDLWIGKPPMARVSLEYSEEAQQLKRTILYNCAYDSNYQNHSILTVTTHLERLWKAILQEDFVFSFQNTFEIVAYNTVEENYSDWSLKFRKDMGDWERAAHNKLWGCRTDQLREVYNKLCKSQLIKFAREAYVKYETMMNKYFDENNEIMLKWRSEIEKRLLKLHEDLLQHANDHSLQLYQSRRDRADAEGKTDELNARIVEKVKQLVGILDKNQMNEAQVIEIFEENWTQWIDEFTRTIKCLEIPNIPYEVEKCVTAFKAKRKFVHQKLADPVSGKSLREWGTHLKLEVMDHHIKVLQVSILGIKIPVTTSRARKSSDLAQKYTNNTLSCVERYLAKLKRSDENFTQQCVTDILCIIQDNRKVESDEFQFTDEYEVEMGLTACGYALQVFQEMAEKFKTKHDPVDFIKNEMKPQFKMMFLNIYNGVDYEKRAAIAVCKQLKEPIKECIMENLSSLIVKEMRGTYSWIKDKQSFTAKILLEIGKKLENKLPDGFMHCITFIINAKESLHYWAEYFTETHCDSFTPSRVSVMAINELSDTIDFIANKAKLVTHSHSQPTFALDEWLKEFHTNIAENIKVSLATLCVVAESKKEVVLPDAKFFTQELLKGLNELHQEIKKTFSGLKYSDVCMKKEPHETIFEAIAGCTQQCPFCDAQCELTNENHPTKGTIKHRVQHRPRGLGNRSWEKEDTLVLDTCPFAIASDHYFSVDLKKNKWHPYKKYSDYYPTWSIPSDNSLESSLYWKWFIGQYNTKIEAFFGREKTKIPEEWRSLKWSKVEEWIKTEYNL